MFPNEFSIYLHDTPTQYLFNKIKRNFSSGCIRIEKPIDLADYLLKGNKSWDRGKLISAVNSNKTKAILLPDPINIHILYWTAWAENDGIIHFRDDIYGRDMQLNMALRRENQTVPETYGKIIGQGEFLSSEVLPIPGPANINMNEF